MARTRGEAGYRFPRRKRITDVLISGSALAALSLSLVAIALLIRLTSRGPALFKQQRLGQDGRTFYMT